MQQKRKVLRAVSSVLPLLLFFTVPASVFAADFSIDVLFEYTVGIDGTTTITQQSQYTNTSESLYIPGGSGQTFYINSLKPLSSALENQLSQQEDSLRVTNASGEPIDYSLENQGHFLEINTAFTKDINQGESATFVINYESNEVAEKVGNIWNIFLPGYSEDIEEVESGGNADIDVRYTTHLRYPATLGTPTLISPEPVSNELVDGEYNISFATKDLYESGAWIQIGDVQYYEFRMTQPVDVDGGNPLSSLFKTRYTLLLPADFANQKVYYESFSPEPAAISKTGEGNILAVFEFDTSNIQDIEITGVMELSHDDTFSIESATSITPDTLTKTYAEINGATLTYADLLKDQEFWEVTDDEIQQTASRLITDGESTLEILRKDYAFVIDTVDYDNLKITLGNERQGALATLQGGSSVCMEYSDLLITLLRAQGIPSRAAFGYTYDPRDDEAQDSQNGHQWVEVFLPDVGWVSVDPTWGDSGRREYIGQDIDHAYWYVAGQNVNTPAQVTRSSRAGTAPLSEVNFEIIATEAPTLTGMSTQASLLTTYQEQTKSEFYLWSDLTQNGRYAAYGITGLILLLVLLIIIQIIRGILRPKSSDVAGPV